MALEALSTTELLRKAADLATPREDLDDRRLWAIIDALHASDPVLLRLLDDADTGGVVAAIRALGALGVEDTAALCRVVNHPATDVRAALAESLCILEGPEVVSTLMRLTRDPDAAVRRSATSGLGGVDHDDTESLRLALVDRLNDPDADTREEAIFVLAQLGDERVGSALREARTEPDTSELIEMAAMAFDNRRQPGGRSGN
jgi:HEAT repeat protein